MSEKSDTRVPITSGRQIGIGDDNFDIRDSGVPVTFADIVVEARQLNGLVYLSLAAGITDGKDPAIADVTNRMRMSLSTAQFVHNVLGTFIKEALTPPVDLSKAN
jgi:hypothetical protein